MTDHEAEEALEAEVMGEDDDDNDVDEENEMSANTIVAAADILPNTLYLLPLSERPFFPAQALVIGWCKAGYSFKLTRQMSHTAVM